MRKKNTQKRVVVQHHYRYSSLSIFVFVFLLLDCFLFQWLIRYHAGYNFFISVSSVYSYVWIYFCFWGRRGSSLSTEIIEFIVVLFVFFLLLSHSIRINVIVNNSTTHFDTINNKNHLQKNLKLCTLRKQNNLNMINFFFSLVVLVVVVASRKALFSSNYCYWNNTPHNNKITELKKTKYSNKIECTACASACTNTE